jgi:hypothetical protein
LTVQLRAPARTVARFHLPNSLEMPVNHYCTYFDRGFLESGLALWLTLKRFDPDAVLWVLGLDDEVVDALRGLGEGGLRVMPLAELEHDDPELAAVKRTRSLLDYYFTLSPCWPRWLLARHPEITVLTYVDADMAFFSSPAPLFAELGANDILIVEHRYPDFLRREGAAERFGRFNVGILCFRQSPEGRRCLKWWRERCLEWCHDRVEGGRFADQKYLDDWPQRFAGVVVCRHPGVNLAPWNWMNHRYDLSAGALLVDGQPLIAYHFALFRPLGRFSCDSGQANFGIMPLRLRSWLYGRYFALRQEARLQVAPGRAPGINRAGRLRPGWKTDLLNLLAGSWWFRIGSLWISWPGGWGRHSGRTMAWFRRRLTPARNRRG